MIDDRLQQAVELHRKGEFDQAQAIYEEILEIRPDHFEALNLLGVLAAQIKNHQRAVDLIDRAIALYPHHAASYFNRGLAQRALGQLEEAVVSYDHAIALSPDYAEAWSNRGDALLEQGRLEAAISSYDHAVSIRPDYAEAWSNRGDALLEQGRLEEAIASYDHAVSIRPEYPEVWYNRGNVLMKLKEWNDAIASYDRAIAIRSGFPEAWSNRGNALNELGKYDESIASYEKAIKLRPTYVEAHSNRSRAMLVRKQWERAVGAYDRLIALTPDDSEAQYSRALALQELKRLDSAIAGYDKAIQLRPDYAEAYANRGVALRELRQFEAAVASYDKAIEINPEYVEAWYNRGNALLELKEYETAVASYDRARGIKPDNAGVWLNRGKALHELKEMDAAIASYDRAIAIKADFAEAYFNRGNVLQVLKQWESAIADYNKAIGFKPDFVEAYSTRGIALKELKKFDEAVECFEKALSINPDGDYLLGELLDLTMKICDWTSFDDLVDRVVRKIVRGEKAAAPFTVFSLVNSAEIQQKASLIYVQDKFRYSSVHRGILKRPRHDKIRLGYYSADFHNHATMHLMAELFEKHDRSRFEIFAFSFGPDQQDDEMRKRAIWAFDRFIDVRSTSEMDVASFSRELEVDIAVDLKGFTKDLRTDIFAFRAAPVQVNYLGYPGTMGAEYIDYIIADHTLVPEQHQQFYTEKTVYLPYSYQVNDAKRQIADKVFSREELGLPSTGFVFCCFNNNYKLTPVIFDSWMRILDRVDGSVLWLLEDNPQASGNLRKEAVRRGVDAGRLVFAGRKPPPEHLARHRCADLFLDTLPCNAHTTASDALWAGLPVLTCLGESFAGRVAASLLNAMQLPELITCSTEEYEATAIELAGDQDKLNGIKLKLEKNRLTTPLFNTDLFTRHIEAAYEQMYERYQLDLPPDHIFVKP